MWRCQTTRPWEVVCPTTSLEDCHASSSMRMPHACVQWMRMHASSPETLPLRLLSCAQPQTVSMPAPTYRLPEVRSGHHSNRMATCWPVSVLIATSLLIENVGVLHSGTLNQKWQHPCGGCCRWKTESKRRPSGTLLCTQGGRSVLHRSNRCQI